MELGIYVEGRPLEELSKEQLIEVIKTMGLQFREARKSLQAMSELATLQSPTTWPDRLMRKF